MPKMIAEPYFGHIVISFLGTAIHNETEVKEVGEMLEHYLISSSEKTIVIDLARVRIMTSAMIGELVKFKKKCDAAKPKRTLKLVNLSPEISEVFKITKMDKIFKIYRDRKKAMGKAAEMKNVGVRERTSLRD